MVWQESRSPARLRLPTSSSADTWWKTLPGPGCSPSRELCSGRSHPPSEKLWNTTLSRLLFVGVFRLRLTGYPRAGSLGCKASGTSDLFPLYVWPFSSEKQTTPWSAGSQRGVIHLFLLSQSVPKGSKEPRPLQVESLALQEWKNPLHTSHPCSEREPKQINISVAVPCVGVSQGKTGNSKRCCDGFLGMNLGWYQSWK